MRLLRSLITNCGTNNTRNENIKIITKGSVNKTTIETIVYVISNIIADG